MKKRRSASTSSFLTVFLVPTLAFSLTSICILKGNIVIDIDAYAKEPNESSKAISIGATVGSSGKSGSGAHGSTSDSDTKSSLDSSNDEVNSINKKNDHAVNDGSDENTNNKFKPEEPPKAGKGEQGSRPVVQPDKTIISLPPPITTSPCEQGTTCTSHYQQNLSDPSHSTTATKDNKTPFILSVPFP
jgi:hypothetical protein